MGKPGQHVETVEKLIPARPEEIFELLAHPSRHAEIDGSATVRASRGDAGQRLTLGATFGMDMRFGGVPYRIKNTVIEFEEGQRIAWRHFGGHIWRYILEPTDGGTTVTEQFDWGASHAPPMLQLFGYPAKNRKSMVATLERMATMFSSR